MPGKELNELLETRNHDQALSYVQNLSKAIGINQISQEHIQTIHSLILSKIDDINAGFYRQSPVRIAGSLTILPNYVKVPILMDELDIKMKQTNQNPLSIACDLHYDFVTIHPFIDGNGRTARLLFNLVLLIAGYPMCFIQKSERDRYLKSLEQAQTGGSKIPYYLLML